jgi:hypothetical protein
MVARWCWLEFYVICQPFSVRRPSKKKLWFSGFEPGTKISLAIVASLHHLPTTSQPPPSEAINIIYHPSCRRAVWVAASLWRRLTQRCRL